MSKTIDQIAEDCKLHGADIETLRNILTDRMQGMGDMDPIRDGFCDIIAHLFRQVQKLDEDQFARMIRFLEDEKAHPKTRGFEVSWLIGALYRRIVVLDRRQEFREAMGIKTEDAKWLDPECHGGCQSLVLKCHSKKLEEGRHSSIDCLNHISIDCQMALNETWDTDYDGFRAMLDNVNDTLRKLGAEPPTEDIKK